MSKSLKKITGEELFQLNDPEFDEFSTVPVGDNPPALTVSLKHAGASMLEKLKKLFSGEVSLEKTTQLFIVTAAQGAETVEAREELAKVAHTLSDLVEDEDLKKGLKAFDKETDADTVRDTIKTLTKSKEKEPEANDKAVAKTVKSDDDAPKKEEDQVSKAQLDQVSKQLAVLQAQMAKTQEEKDFAVARERLNKSAQAPGSSLDDKAAILVTLEKANPEAAKLFIKQNERDGIRLSEMRKMGFRGYDVNPAEQKADDAMSARIKELTKSGELDAKQAMAKLMSDPDELDKLARAEWEAEVA